MQVKKIGVIYRGIKPKVDTLCNNSCQGLMRQNSLFIIALSLLDSTQTLVIVLGHKIALNVLELPEHSH